MFIALLMLPENEKCILLVATTKVPPTLLKKSAPTYIMLLAALNRMPWKQNGENVHRSSHRVQENKHSIPQITQGTLEYLWQILANSSSFLASQIGSSRYL